MSRRTRPQGEFKKPLNGFTLIELLVVIAIIAILAAILFPVFAKAREKARQSTCGSNMKQIGVALLQYTQDYDEMLPFFFYGANGNPSDPAAGLYKWMDAAYPYIKSEQVFSCPDYSLPSGINYPYKYYKNQTSDGTHLYYGGYGINVMYRYDSSGTRTPPTGAYLVGLNIAGLQAPSSTAWIVDGTTYYFGWSCLAAGAGCTSTQPGTVVNTGVTPNQIDNMVARHTDMSNILYCDGHVKSSSLNNLASQKLADGTLTAFTIQAD